MYKIFMTMLLMLTSSVLFAHPHHTHADAVTHHGVFANLLSTEFALLIALIVILVLLVQPKHFARNTAKK